MARFSWHVPEKRFRIFAVRRGRREDPSGRHKILKKRQQISVSDENGVIDWWE
ncbi:hypothetical protein ACZ87_04072 [Candidatus Erwinia dacicola]|uniref:Uncharacterized protein n=1 Tax=Candidatus Erwinia dacicola TaxID=252393 RepID=A0A328T580_9GAMM|nr:hypothetical protein ACZ87_04072 [Candidatus Erwinia dacicola]